MMKSRLRLFSSKALLISFLLAIVVVCLTVYITGIQFHRNIYYNSILSLSILFVAFFLFLTYGLYFGFDIKPTVKRLTDKFQFVESSGSPLHGLNFEFPSIDFGDGLEGLLLGIVLWIGLALLVVILLFFFETIVWAAFLIALGSIHWIFFRAIRLVLRRSGSTKGNLIKSVYISAYYSIIYIGWIYGIVYLLYWYKR